MDTVKKPNKRKAAVLVDYNLFISSQELRDWLDTHKDDAEYVLLVDPPIGPGEKLAPTAEDTFEVVIQNSGKKGAVNFKMNALRVVQDMSNLIPVIAFDADSITLKMYEENGILIAQDF